MKCQATFHAHSDGVNAVACLPSRQGQGLIMTAGKDHQVRLWQAIPGGSGPGEGGAWACHLVAQYAAHTDAVEGIAVRAVLFDKPVALPAIGVFHVFVMSLFAPWILMLHP